MLLKDLVFDKSIYPRGGINYTHIGDMVNAMLAGVIFPPIIVEKGTNRIVDGVHRYHSFLKLHGKQPDYDVAVEERTYADENTLWEAAVEANTSHGLGYSTYDRTHILVEAAKRGISRERIAEMIHMPVDKMERHVETRTGWSKPGANAPKERIALRTSMKGLAGKTLTKAQREANKRGGMKAEYHVTALLDLLGADILEWCSKDTRLKLSLLSESLVEKLAESSLKAGEPTTQKKASHKMNQKAKRNAAAAS